MLISGAIGLFGAGLMVGLFWSERRTDASAPAPLVEDETGWPGWLRAAAAPGARGNRPVAAPEAEIGSSASVAASAQSAPRATTARGAGARGAAPQAAPSVEGIASGGALASVGASEVSAVGVVATSVSMTVPELTLRGTIQSADSAAVVEVEFVLRRRNESVSGVVRYLAGDERVAANAVSGRILGRTMELRETSLIWVRGPRSAPLLGDVGAEATLASFVFALPAENKTDPIVGDWSRGRTSGTLRVVPSLPW